MNFLSNSIGIAQFRIDKFSSEFWQEAENLLKQYAFLPIDDLPELEAHGWANFDNMLDTVWQDSPPQKGDLFCFGLRIDKRRIPPALLQKDFYLALEQEKQRVREQGKRFISRERRKEIKEQVRLRLLEKIPPTPSFIQVIWDTDQNIILVASTNSNTLQTFSDYFCLTFGTRPQPLWLLADMVFETKQDAIEPAVFSATAHADQDNLVTVLGKEWLTWLLYRSQKTNGIHALPDKTSLEAVVERRITTLGGIGDARETTSIAGTAVSPLKEAISSLATGKKVSVVTLHMEAEGYSWSVTLHADAQCLYGLRTPKLSAQEEDDEPDARLLEKYFLVQKCCWHIDFLAQQFMKLRMDDTAWASEVTAMQTWVRQEAA